MTGQWRMLHDNENEYDPPKRDPVPAGHCYVHRTLLNLDKTCTACREAEARGRMQGVHPKPATTFPAD